MLCRFNHAPSEPNLGGQFTPCLRRTPCYDWQMRALVTGGSGRVGSAIAKRLGEAGWSVLAAGRHQMPFAAQSVLLGGSVRVGLEDSLYIERGKLAASNAEQVRKVRQIIESLGYDIATAQDVREWLGLKGAHAVGF